MKRNIIVEKSFEFSVMIVNLYKYLVSEKREYVLSKQLLRSGTSIGANINEAVEGQSKKDFISKMNIALKEARESKYWLELLERTEYISGEKSKNILLEIDEIIRILVKIVKTSRERL